MPLETCSYCCNLFERDTLQFGDVLSSCEEWMDVEFAMFCIDCVVLLHDTPPRFSKLPLEHTHRKRFLLNGSRIPSLAASDKMTSIKQIPISSKPKMEIATTAAGVLPSTSLGGVASLPPHLSAPTTCGPKRCIILDRNFTPSPLPSPMKFVAPSFSTSPVVSFVSSSLLPSHARCIVPPTTVNDPSMLLSPERSITMSTTLRHPQTTTNIKKHRKRRTLTWKSKPI